MASVHLESHTERFDPDDPETARLKVSRLEGNLRPLNVKLTYDVVLLLAEFFVYHHQEKSKRDKKYHDMKKRFLPGSQQVLDIQSLKGYVYDLCWPVNVCSRTCVSIHAATVPSPLRNRFASTSRRKRYVKGKKGNSVRMC